jgi:hypothetical protein
VYELQETVAVQMQDRASLDITTLRPRVVIEESIALDTPREQVILLYRCGKDGCSGVIELHEDSFTLQRLS